MRRGTRWLRLLLASAFLAGACTQPPETPPSPSSPVSDTPSTSPSVVPTGARLADGTPLPEGCSGAVVRSQTVAFMAEDRAWALDPDTNRLTCLLPVEEPGPFSWGPQGDRVLLDRFEIRGVGPDAPDLPAIQTPFSAFDWGHPIGLAVAFADGNGHPRKRFIDDGHVIKLDALPAGTYLQVAYHPSGLALGVRRGDRRGAGDLVVDERRRGSPTADLLQDRGRRSPRSSSQRTESDCGGRPSTRRDIPSCTS